MEVIERYKVSIQQTTQQTQIHPISELRVQVSHLQVDLVQLLVDEGDQRLLDNQQLLRSMVKESIKGVSLTPHPHIIIVTSQLLGNDSVGEDPLSLGHDHHVHDDILRESDGGSEVPGQGDQEVEDGDNVLGVDGLHAPPGLVSLQTKNSVSHAQHDPETRGYYISIALS